MFSEPKLVKVSPAGVLELIPQIVLCGDRNMADVLDHPDKVVHVEGVEVVPSMLRDVQGQNPELSKILARGSTQRVYCIAFPNFANPGHIKVHDPLTRIIAARLPVRDIFRFTASFIVTEHHGCPLQGPSYVRPCRVDVLILVDQRLPQLVLEIVVSGLAIFNHNLDPLWINFFNSHLGGQNVVYARSRPKYIVRLIAELRVHQKVILSDTPITETQGTIRGLPISLGNFVVLSIPNLSFESLDIDVALSTDLFHCL